MPAPTLTAFLDAAATMPPSATVNVHDVAALIREAVRTVPEPPPRTGPLTWREMLWTVPAETRLSLPEVCEALGRSRSWVARRLTTPASERPIPIPHRRLDGVLSFVAGEVRAWLAQVETIGQAGTLDTRAPRPRVP